MTSILVFRHRKENLRKCSLRGLEGAESFHFFTYPFNKAPDLEDFILLTPEAPPLSVDDQTSSLLLLDGTWKYAQKMEKAIPWPGSVRKKSLPADIRTAYPRRQTDCTSPERGLASVEAIYSALFILGEPRQELLDHYYWKEVFLSINQDYFSYTHSTSRIGFGQRESSRD